MPEDFAQLVDSVRDYQDATEYESVSRRRGNLAVFIEKFHSECGTLCREVQRKIDVLRSQKCRFLMTAHQPNLFAYSGVLRKATLTHSLSCELERHSQVPVVSFFGIADQDFTDDRWVKSTLLPALHRKKGTLALQIRLPPKKMIKEVQKPPVDVMDRWKGNVGEWLARTLNLIDKSLETNMIREWRQKRTALEENLEELWKIAEVAYERCETYSDFNAFVMSRIVNEAWGYDTLFARFSECQRIFNQEFEYLLSHSREYSSALREARKMMIRQKGRGAVSESEPELLPFWYHCDCGGKSRLSLERKDESLVGIGRCTSCHEKYRIDLGTEESPDVSLVSTRISARAIAMALVFFKGLGVSCYVGGTGGFDYLAEANYVADRLNIPFPPIAFWRPNDRYLGIGQLEAILEFRRITGNLNISNWEAEMDNLKGRIKGVYDRIDELEAEKEGLVKQLRSGHQLQRGNLRERIMNTSRKQSRIRRASNLSVLNRDLKLLENVPVTLNLIPSIIDYAANIGLKETSEQWKEFLRRDGRLSSSVLMESVLDDLTELRPFASAIPHFSNR